MLVITSSLAVAGIEVFQVAGNAMSANFYAELVFVIILAILIGMGILFMVLRNRDIKEGIVTGDEMTAGIVRESGSLAFFVSMVSWVILLVIDVHTGADSPLLITCGLLVMSFTFLLSWGIRTLLSR